MIESSFREIEIESGWAWRWEAEPDLTYEAEWCTVRQTWLQGLQVGEGGWNHMELPWPVPADKNEAEEWARGHAQMAT